MSKEHFLILVILPPEVHVHAHTYTHLQLFVVCRSWMLEVS